MFKESISQEELTELPLKWFEGEIVLVDSVKDVHRAVKMLSGESVIGFDTETKPSFKKGVNNNVALLQLSTKNTAFLFRLNNIGLPASICSILTNPYIIKPGVAIHDALDSIHQDRHSPYSAE